MDIRKRPTLLRPEQLHQFQKNMNIGNSVSNEIKGDVAVDVNLLLFVWEQIRMRGLQSIPRFQREKVISILTSAIPQFNSLFKKNQDKFMDVLKGFRVERLIKNDLLTTIDGSFKKVYVLLSGTVAVDFETPDVPPLNQRGSILIAQEPMVKSRLSQIFGRGSISVSKPNPRMSISQARPSVTTARPSISGGKSSINRSRLSSILHNLSDSIPDDQSRQLLLPITLIGKDLFQIPTSQIINRVSIKTAEAILLSSDVGEFQRLTYGAIPNAQVLQLIQILKNCPLLTNLSPHQIVDLGFSGKVWQLEKRTTIVKQQKTIKESLLSRATSLDGFIYITLEGQFVLQCEISAGNPDKLDLQRYLAHFCTTNDVPLMHNQSLHSLSPHSKQLRKNIELTILGAGEIIGISELVNKEPQWRYSLQTQNQGAKVNQFMYCKILEIDLTNVGGSLHFSDLLGIFHDKNTAHRQESRLNKLGETIQQDEQRLGEYLIRQREILNRNSQLSSSGMISQQENNFITQQSLRPLSTQKNESITIKSENNNVVWQDPDLIVEQLIEKKATIFQRIKTQSESIKKKQRSLVEEFAEYDPYFLKLLRIKIFSETYTPHQDSIFSKIKSLTTEKNNFGIYMNKVRSTSCADNSFLLLDHYRKSTNRNKKQKIKFEVPNMQTIVHTPTSEFYTPSTSGRISSAIKNVKRKLKSSRQSSRPQSQRQGRQLSDHESQNFLWKN